ncbi:hypothetical protein KA005_57830 [bacterium]|nr:hypothetical protein [bacterium]
MDGRGQKQIMEAYQFEDERFNSRSNFPSGAGNDHNLAAGRYKPMVVKAALDDDPAELIQEVLDIEKDITKGLAKLLMEIKK